MSLIRSFRLKHGERAVSPVVGVMLMLVVTIIIAAVVSAFAGGLYHGQQKTPSAVINTLIKSDGHFGLVQMQVESINPSVSTADLKLITRWTTTAKYTNASSTPPVTEGQTINGGGTVTALPAGTNNSVYYSSSGTYPMVAPCGLGAGIVNSSGTMGGQWTPYQNFGNYSLMPGTIMRSGSTRVDDISTVTPNEGVTAILGNGWNNLRPGDTVNVNLIYVPTGGSVYREDVVVES